MDEKSLRQDTLLSTLRTRRRVEKEAGGEPKQCSGSSKCAPDTFEDQLNICIVRSDLEVVEGRKERAGEEDLVDTSAYTFSRGRKQASLRSVSTLHCAVLGWHAGLGCTDTEHKGTDRYYCCIFDRAMTATLELRSDLTRGVD